MVKETELQRRTRELVKIFMCFLMAITVLLMFANLDSFSKRAFMHLTLLLAQVIQKVLKLNVRTTGFADNCYYFSMLICVLKSDCSFPELTAHVLLNYLTEVYFQPHLHASLVMSPRVLQRIHRKSLGSLSDDKNMPLDESFLTNLNQTNSNSVKSNVQLIERRQNSLPNDRKSGLLQIDHENVSASSMKRSASSMHSSNFSLSKGTISEISWNVSKDSEFESRRKPSLQVSELESSSDNVRIAIRTNSDELNDFDSEKLGLPDAASS